MKRPSVLNIWQVCDFPVLSLGSVFEANTINTNTFVVGFFVASKTYQRIALSLGNVFVILRTIYLYYRWDMERGTKKTAVANTFCLLLSGASKASARLLVSNMAGIDQPFFRRDGELRQNSPNSIRSKYAIALKSRGQPYVCTHWLPYPVNNNALISISVFEEYQKVLKRIEEYKKYCTFVQFK